MTAPEGQAKVFGALSRDEDALRTLVTTSTRTIGASPPRTTTCGLTIPALRDVLTVGRPALRSLDTALPSSRVRLDALPGARSAPATLDAQILHPPGARAGVRARHGAVRDLRPTVPRSPSSTAARRGPSSRRGALASCQNNVLLPFSRHADPRPRVRRHALGRAVLRGVAARVRRLAGESRGADANWRSSGAGRHGPTTVFSTGETGAHLRPAAAGAGRYAAAQAGRRRARVPPRHPCEQEPPDMNTLRRRRQHGAPGPHRRRALPTGHRPAEGRAREGTLKLLKAHVKAEAEGRPTIDPLESRTRAASSSPAPRPEPMPDGTTSASPEGREP